MDEPDLDNYRPVPNHATSLGGLLLAAIALAAGAISISTAESATAEQIGYTLLTIGGIGVFIMIAAIAVVSAIYKARD